MPSLQTCRPLNGLLLFFGHLLPPERKRQSAARNPFGNGRPSPEKETDIDPSRLLLSTIPNREDGDGDEEELPTLRWLADYLRQEESKKKEAHRPDPNAPQYEVILMEALDDALDMIGRSGKDVLYQMLEERYGFGPSKLASEPGRFLSAMRHLLGHSELVVENLMMKTIAGQTDVKGETLEEVVAKLKNKFPDPRPSKGR